MSGFLNLLAWLMLGGGILLGSTLLNGPTYLWAVLAFASGIVWFAVFQAAGQALGLLERIADSLD